MSHKVVAVTGASGFVAGEVIKQLLEKGYTVRGTVRSLVDKNKTSHLTETFQGLQLFEADLLVPGSFDECFKGVDAVFHTASPFLKHFSDPQKELVDPALLGTKNVLSSIEKNLETIKTLVVTSSAAAIVCQNAHLKGDRVWTELDWNTTSTLTEGAYRYSKSLAERAAWDWAEGKQIKLRTVCPTFVLGPPHSKRTDSTSVWTVIELLNGKTKREGAQNTSLGAVDIRDVGKVHLACLEHPNANGRYLVSSERGVAPLELAEMLKEEFGDKYPLPTHQVGAITFNPRYDSSKVTRDFGIVLTPVKKSVVDMAHALIDFGLVELQ